MLLAGCVGMPGGPYDYSLAVRNTGTQTVWCSLVVSVKGIAHDPGILIPGADKTLAGPFRRPYADKWTVRWTTANGEEFEKSLDLTKAFRKRFSGRLVFTIDAQNNLGYVTESYSGE